MRDRFPLVSIIIPVYNGANYMCRAIDSALRQTYKNIEIIVVNDGSTDGGETERIARSYGERIRYISKDNGGASTALNTGIKAMRGEYFSWLSHDDEYGPRKIELQIGQVSRYPHEMPIALCGDRQINERSELLRNLSCQKLFPDGELINWKDVLLNLLIRGCFNGCALLIPKKVFEKCGLFNEDLQYSQDYLMWLKIFLAGYPLVYSNEVQVYSRVHDKQGSNTRKDQFYKDSKTISDLLLPEFASISTKNDNFVYSFACYNAKYNNASAVEDCINIGIERKLLSPTHIMRIKVLGVYGTIRPFIRKMYYRLYKCVSINVI